MEKETLKERTAKGLFWGGLNSLTQQVIGIIFAIILGRLLDNADFGMMAMIGVFSLIATTLQNSGFPTALANMKEPRDEDYNSVFWFNIIVGFSAYLVLFFCAPLIAAYYNEPRLIPLCRYAFLSILIASFGTAQNAYLFKNLKARQQAKASMTAVVVSSVTGAACAFAGLAYWSLATQGLVYVSINTLMAWHYSPWRPSLHGITFEPVKRMLRFSFKILLSNHHQQQYPQLFTGPLLHGSRHRKLQSGLSVGLKMLQPRAKYGESGGPARACRPAKRQ